MLKLFRQSRREMEKKEEREKRERERKKKERKKEKRREGEDEQLFPDSFSDRSFPCERSFRKTPRELVMR